MKVAILFLTTFQIVIADFFKPMFHFNYYLTVIDMT